MAEGKAVAEVETVARYSDIEAVVDEEAVAEGKAVAEVETVARELGRGDGGLLRLREGEMVRVSDPVVDALDDAATIAAPSRRKEVQPGSIGSPCGDNEQVTFTSRGLKDSGML